MGDLYVKHKKKELVQEKIFLPDHPLKIEVMFPLQSTINDVMIIYILQQKKTF